MKRATQERQDELKALLIRACPDNERGKTVLGLAILLKCSSTSIYKWIQKATIPGPRARAIVELPGSTATLEDFAPFL